MNFRTTGLLVGLLIVVGLVWLFLPRGQTPTDLDVPEKTTPTESKYVFTPQPNDEDIVRVEIERPDRPRLAFERVPRAEDDFGAEEWQIIEPLNAPAEGYKVGGLVRTLTGLQYQQRIEPDAPGAISAAEAGLEPALATITLHHKDGQSTRVEIGKKAVMSSDTYVRVGGQKTIYVAQRDLRPQLQEDLKDYRTKRLLRLKNEEITSVRLEHEGRTYEFTRSDGDWVIETPVRTYADGNKVRSKLLTPLTTLQAAEFAEDAPTALTPYGLDEPFLKVTVTTQKKRTTPTTAAADTQPAESGVEIVSQTHHLLVGGYADLKNEKRFAQTGQGPWLVMVRQSDVANLVPNLNELRDARVLRIKAADVTAIQVNAADGRTASISKVDDTWQGSGDLAELDAAAVQDLLSGLEGLTAISFVDEPGAAAEYGLDQPRAVLTVTVSGQVAPITLRVGADTASGRNTYVQRDDQPTVMVVSAAQAGRVAIDPLALRSRDVFDFAAEQITRMRVERDGARYALVRLGPDEWRMADPEGAPPDPAAVRLLANNLSRLRGRKVVGKDDAARFGLNAPALTVQFEVRLETVETQPTTAEAAPPTRHVLRVGLKDGVAYGQRDDDPYVFELDESVYGTLSGVQIYECRAGKEAGSAPQWVFIAPEAELIDARIFRFEAEDVHRIRIVGTGGTLELLREGDRWVYAPDPFVELDQKKVQDFVQELAQLRAETWLAYRDADLAVFGLDRAPASVTITLSGGREVIMHLAQEQPGEVPRRAALVNERRVCRLRVADSQKIFRGLDEYLKADKPK